MTLPNYAMSQLSFPEMYERWLVGPLFRPWAEMSLEVVELSPGDRVLDIACGTGIVARVASERFGNGGQVVSVDLSPDMLAVARTVAPDIDWRQGDASARRVAEHHLGAIVDQRYNFGDAASLHKVIQNAAFST